MTYTYIKDGEKFGPFSLHELDEQQALGKIRYDQLVIPDNGDEPMLIGVAHMKDRNYFPERQRRMEEHQRTQQKMSEAAIPGVFRAAELFAPILLCIMFSGGFLFGVCGAISDGRWNLPFFIMVLITGLLAVVTFFWARARIRKERKSK